MDGTTDRGNYDKIDLSAGAHQQETEASETKGTTDRDNCDKIQLSAGAHQQETEESETKTDDCICNVGLEITDDTVVYNCKFDDENGRFTNDDCMDKNRIFRIFLPGGYPTEFTVLDNNIANISVQPTVFDAQNDMVPPHDMAPPPNRNVLAPPGEFESQSGDTTIALSLSASNGSSNTTTTDTPANHTNATSPFKVSQEEEEPFGLSEVGRELGLGEPPPPSDSYSYFHENLNIVTTDDAKKCGVPHHRSLPPPRNLNGEFSGPNKRHKTNN